MEISEKLDMLAEFYSQKDALELRKRELLNEIQVPAEIEAIVKKGMEDISAVDAGIFKGSREFDARIDARVAEIVIPQEYKDEWEKLDAQRSEIVAKMDELIKPKMNELEAQKRAIRNEQADFHAAMMTKTAELKQKIQAEIEAKTRGVYDAINQKKQEIEVEFSGKADDADANIKKLEAEIKAEVKAAGASVKGKYLHAVYVKGRVTWNTDKMDAWCNDHPFLKEARKEGEPSITLRKI